MSSRLTRVGGLTVPLALLPAAAYAVNVSSNDGSGEQHRTASYSNGAAVTGSLKSTSGKAVYYSGKVALSSCQDPDTGRYSSNVTSTSAVTRGGTISYGPILPPCGFQGVKSKVCRDITAAPDTCGSDSSLY